MAKIQALLERTFGFVPDWFIGLGLVCVAILCALLVHKIAVVLAKRAIGPRRSIAIQILDATTGPTRLAMCLAAVAFEMPLAPLGEELRAALTRLFVVASISLIGWTSIRAVDLSS